MFKSKEDMFADTQQTPVVMKPPSTPSMTPTRSVRRKSSMIRANTPRTTIPKREAVSCSSSKSQSFLHEDFYDLRTRQVPLSNNINEIWALCGIKDTVPVHASQRVYHRSPSTSEDNLLERSPVKSEKRTKSSIMCPLWYVFGISTLMVFSAFLGAVLYAHMQHHFPMSSSRLPLQLSQHSQVDRSADSSTQTHQLENSILHLTEEIKRIKELLSNIRENVGSEVIASPQKGVLEELLIADLACAGNLGSILATPGTTTVTVPATVTLLGFFSFNFRMNHRQPHTTIEGVIQEVGDCWPFEGSKGRLVLKLHRRSLVTGVSISHIPPSVSVSGDVSSAPRSFQILAHQKDDLENGITLGQFEYKASGTSRQTFPLDSKKAEENVLEIIEFRFLENHGNPNYTCVYRVHVHGNFLK